MYSLWCVRWIVLVTGTLRTESSRIADGGTDREQNRVLKLRGAKEKKNERTTKLKCIPCCYYQRRKSSQNKECGICDDIRRDVHPRVCS